MMMMMGIKMNNSDDSDVNNGCNDDIHHDIYIYIGFGDNRIPIKA